MLSVEESREKIYQAAEILKETGLYITLHVVLDREGADYLGIIRGEPDPEDGTGIHTVRDHLGPAVNTVHLMAILDTRRVPL